MNYTQNQENKTNTNEHAASISYRIIKFDPKNATDDEWAKFFHLREKLHYEHTPDDPFYNHDVLKKRMAYDDPYVKSWRWLALLNDEYSTVIGYVFLNAVIEASPEYEENKHVSWAYIIVDKDYQRRGIGRELINVIIPKLKEYNRTIIQAWNEYDSGKAFARSLGGMLAYKNYENRLKFSEIDWEKMKRWVDEGKERAPGIRIRTFEDVPKEIIEEYVHIFTETANQAPLEDLEGKDVVTPESRRFQEDRERYTGTKWITKISIETDNKISGLTEILYNPKESYVIYQELTGVKKEYRGRGLGKMLKAEMLFLIREQFPHIDHLRTGNAMSNAPMLAINKGMGYKENKRYETYKFKIEDLEKLNS
ncbi:MAG: GNAT family N-acetyltransferase [Candidatus Kariarchaeaceae archaeon]